MRNRETSKMDDSRDEYDFAFEEGAENWNILLFDANRRSHIFWETVLL